MPQELHEEIRALNLGKKIRGLRTRSDLTLQGLSNLTGLSKPLLSQIENGIIAPPIATLLKISRALGVNIGHFFQEDSTHEWLVVVREEERREVMRRFEGDGAKVGYRYESLAYPWSDKHMEPFMVEIEPRSEEELTFYNHAGEEFLFVLAGAVEFRGGDKVIILATGDSIYFDSEVPHAVRGLGGEKARAIAVIYSPRA